MGNTETAPVCPVCGLTVDTAGDPKNQEMFKTWRERLRDLATGLITGDKNPSLIMQSNDLFFRPGSISAVTMEYDESMHFVVLEVCLSSGLVITQTLCMRAFFDDGCDGEKSE